MQAPLAPKTTTCDTALPLPATIVDSNKALADEVLLHPLDVDGIPRLFLSVRRLLVLEHVELRLRLEGEYRGASLIQGMKDTLCIVYGSGVSSQRYTDAGAAHEY